ncbi:MAG: beta-lactamase family protein [Gemmatimonadetes bacterium]|nr:beta-lactamase family protein [Gemmatimonadota bacterium]MCC7131911.1 beta-lactamase family protein [Gemmatimonadales bacterium]
MGSSTVRLVAALIASTMTVGTLTAQSVASHPRVREAVAAYEKWLDGQRAFSRIPGVASALVVDQEVIWQGGSGVADVDRKTPATASTLYSICSISKLFTSIAALQLRDQGKLRLDDPVARHLPWFRPPTEFSADGPITVEGLLTHAAGLQRELADTLWLEPNMAFPTIEEVMAGVAAREVTYRPGQYFHYSNLGFTLAGAVVAAAAGRSYHDYVRAQILTPLGMSDTYSEMPPAERGKRLATGYSGIDRDGNRHPMPFYQTRAMAPAAGYASSALDLARFASWQFRLLDRGGAEVLAAPTLREMQRVHFVDPGWETTWGLGFEVWRHDGKTFVGHGGSCPGYRTHLLLKPDEKIATITMANTFDANAMALAQQAYQFLGPAVKEARADSARTVAAADPSLDRYLGSYWSFGGEMEVIRWQGGLATMAVPSADPVKSITKYRKVGEHTFREVREDGALGERMVFDIGPDGRPTRARTNYLFARIPGR